MSFVVIIETGPCQAMYLGKGWIFVCRVLTLSETKFLGGMIPVLNEVLLILGCVWFVETQFNCKLISINKYNVWFGCGPVVTGVVE